MSKGVSPPYLCNIHSKTILISEFYSSSEMLSVKLSVTINRKFEAKVYVHQKELKPDHKIWVDLPKVYDNIMKIKWLLSELELYSVCIGNHDEEFLKLETGKYLEGDYFNGNAYREGVNGLFNYSSTIRSRQCDFLLQKQSRCNSYMKIGDVA